TLPSLCIDKWKRPSHEDQLALGPMPWPGLMTPHAVGGEGIGMRSYSFSQLCPPKPPLPDQTPRMLCCAMGALTLQEPFTHSVPASVSVPEFAACPSGTSAQSPTMRGLSNGKPLLLV